MTNPRIKDNSFLSPFQWLLGAGIFLVTAGLLGGLAARQSADIASFLASQPKRALLAKPSAPISSSIALKFDPASAHYVPPDYTLFWLLMAIAVIGALLIVTTVLLGHFERRRS